MHDVIYEKNLKDKLAFLSDLPVGLIPQPDKVHISICFDEFENVKMSSKRQDGTTDTIAGTLHHTKNIAQKLKARSPLRVMVRALNFLNLDLEVVGLQDLSAFHSFCATELKM